MDMGEEILKYPIAPRVRESPLKPYVGPTLDDYKKEHAKTVGGQSDEWWGKVSKLP